MARYQLEGTTNIKVLSNSVKQYIDVDSIIDWVRASNDNIPESMDNEGAKEILHLMTKSLIRLKNKKDNA